jgi:hypothetical protein
MILSGARPALVTAAGEPIPPQSVIRRLQEISPRLSLVWVGGGHVRYWGLRERWRNGDPRWEHVQTGKIPFEKAYDVVMTFPPDCQGDDMAAFVEQHYGERNMLSKADASKEADRIVNAQIAADAKVREGHIERAHTESVERFERETRHALRVRAGAEKAHPMVPGESLM